MLRYLKLKTVVACSLFAASLSSFAAVSTQAAADDDHPSRVVKFADLDLTHSQGAAVLYARIRSAARAVCLPKYNWLMEMRSIPDECRDQAIARAVDDVNAPALTTYHRERRGKAIAAQGRWLPPSHVFPNSIVRLQDTEPERGRDRLGPRPDLELVENR